jgi:Rad3-related DNA helicase
VREFELRPYQLESIERLRQGIRDGHRSQILCAPTGSGKTIIAAYLMDAAARKFNRVAFIVDRVNLVDQTSAVLEELRHRAWRDPGGALALEAARARAGLLGANAGEARLPRPSGPPRRRRGALRQEADRGAHQEPC